MHKPIIGLLIGLVTTVSLTLSATVPDYSFRRYNMSSGLPSDMVGALIQDSNGLIWIGTGEGAVCFDGRVMHRYDMKDGNRLVGGLSVNSLVEDRNHNIWAGCDDGLYVHRVDEGQAIFERLKTVTPSGQMVNTLISTLAIDHDGLIWISTRGQGVMCYNPQSDLLTSYSDEYGPRVVESVFVDSSNTVWAAFSEDLNCVYAFNRAESDFRRFDIDLGGLKTRLGVITEDSSSNIWFASWDSGLFMFDRNSGRAKRFASGNEGFHNVHSILELRPGEFLVGSDDGLLWYNVITSETKLFGNERGTVTSLSNKFVYPVMKDSEGGLWIGTYYGGVNYVNPNSGQFVQVTKIKGQDMNEEFVVSCFAQDSDGSIWVGSDNVGVAHYHDNGECISIPASRSWNVHSLLADPQCVWVGTYGGGLNRIDKKSGTVKNYSYNYGFDDSSVYALKRDSRGKLWAATATGFFTYSQESDRFENRYTTGSLCYDIEESYDGDLWFTTISRGVFRYCPSEGTWRNYSFDAGTMISDCAISLYASKDGNIYVATSAGLARYYESDDSFKLQGMDGMGSILYVQGDGDNLWLTSTNRLHKYSLADGSVTTYDYGDGMINGQFMVNAGLVANSGKMFLGTAKGFNVFIPENISINTVIPPVMITSFEFRDRKGTASRGGDLYHYVNINEDITLDWRRNDVRFSFVGLSFCSPRKNHFAYKLEGFDSQWTEAAYITDATYTNLPAGKYRFVVKACNNDGVWNDNGASVEFRIRPHLMRTFAAKVLYVLLFLALTYWAYRYFRARSEKKMQVDFERKESEREALELESKVSFLTSIAHEVRTPLSLIIAPVERLRASAAAMGDQDREYLDVIDRNCTRLGRLINQLLDYSRLNAETNRSFEFQKSDVGTFIRSVSSSFMPTFEKEGITFTETYPEEPLMADIDTESMTTIVMNLLSNAAKYAGDKVDLALSSSGEYFSIIVSDNGPGISNELKGRIFHPFFRANETSVGTGLGLAILKKMVDSLGGSVSVDDASEGGSIFTVLLPVNQPETHNEASDAEPTSQKSARSDAHREETTQKLKVGDTDRQTILIVEDDIDMRSFLVSDFKNIYNVLEAQDAETAEHLLFQYDISLIISDWMMPGKSGADLCRFVRSRKTLCQLPFIMLTAKADDASQLESMDCGADAHVKKPFSPEHLRALVAHLIRMRDMLAQRYSSLQTTEPERNGSDDDFFSRLTEIIESNISNTELSVEMLAKELCVSRSGLFAKVKATSGGTPNRLIMDIRLKAAAKMLKESKHSVSEISYMAGFNSPSYFSKCFSSQYGMTPHQWMEKQKGLDKSEVVVN